MAVSVQAPSHEATGTAARGLAIFDLDRTILAGSSLSMYGRALAGAGVVRRSQVARHALTEAAFAARGVSGATVERICTRLLRVAAGHDLAPLVEIADEAAPSIAARMYPGARLLLDQHRRLGDLVVVLSASPGPLLRALAPHLGVHMTIGTEPEVVEGRLTGRLASEFCHGPAKVRRLQETLGGSGLSHAVAYGDAESDIPMLQAAGRAVAVNPDRRLRAAAAAAGWPVLTFG
ncbi:MAG TPA: HAD-IB family hydrolase [Acidimicrobiales bacterium]|nr:HAD-IB family hydrolase [Acidimicrobiales bacterium]